MSASPEGIRSEHASGTLNDRYLKVLRWCDRRAIRHRWWYEKVWLTIAVFMWLPLLMVIGSLLIKDNSVANVVLFWLVPICSGIVSVLTVAQLFWSPQSKWLACRAGAEELKRHGMMYRFGLPPFDGEDADAQLSETIEQIRVGAERQERRGFPRRPKVWYLLYLVYTPRKFRGTVASTPDAGIEPRYVGRTDDEAQNAVVLGRLNEQRKWYMRRARQNAGAYVLFQLLIVGVSLGNSLLARWWSGNPDVILPVFGITTAVHLFLLSCRDFFRYIWLFINYVVAAGLLAELKESYTKAKPPFDIADPTTRLQRLAQEIEETLSSEFQHWYSRQ